MTVKQLIRKLKNPPCERIAAVRIEFADGGIYEVARTLAMGNVKWGETGHPGAEESASYCRTRCAASYIFYVARTFSPAIAFRS